MFRRLLVALAGASLGAAFYAALGTLAAPSLLEPMGPTGLGLPKVSVRVVDSTPVRLIIGAIGVDARIEARGLDSGRNLATPNDFRDVAWYSAGPRPGQPGNAVINGHVNWWTGDAVFTHLSRVRAGDVVKVVRADGITMTFQVTSKHTVDADARIASLFAPSTDSTITLITCSGVWNPLTQSDTRRLLVYARLV
jgi:LPXTG-site transpeptidase (sortase) family protein